MADLLLGTVNPPLKARILVVEDDAHIRTFCQRLLRISYEVDVAEHGGEALTQLKAKPYDLVLTDMQMPVMGGIELLQHIRQHYPETDLVVLTAYATVENAREALKLGALDYLSKPIETENLERTVRQCLELRRVRQKTSSIRMWANSPLRPMLYNPATGRPAWRARRSCS